MLTKKPNLIMKLLKILKSSKHLDLENSENYENSRKKIFQCKFDMFNKAGKPWE